MIKLNTTIQITILLLSALCAKAGDSLQFSSNPHFFFGYSRTQANVTEFGLVGENFKLKPKLFREIRNDGYFVKGHRYYNISAEYDYKNEIAGGNVGYYIGGIVAVGSNLNYDTTFKSDFFGIKPMIGFDFSYIQLFYGYNFNIYGSNIKAISGHTFRIMIYLPDTSNDNKKQKKKKKK